MKRSIRANYSSTPYTVISGTQPAFPKIRKNKHIVRLHNMRYIDASTFLSADLAVEHILMCLMPLMLIAAVLNSTYGGVTLEFTPHSFQ